VDFNKIDELKAELNSIRSLYVLEMWRLRNEFIIENAYDSNAMEGNTLTFEETENFLQKGITSAEKATTNYIKLMGYKKAFEYITSIAEADILLTERIVKEIHSLVLMNDSTIKGIYRKAPVGISQGKNILTEDYAVIRKMDTLIADYNEMKKNKHRIEAIAEFHLRFEGIRPFSDGNGRTNRLILNMGLMEAGLLPVNIRFEERQKYYDCFDNYHATGNNPEMLIELIAGYEMEELEKIIKILKSKKRHKP